MDEYEVMVSSIDGSVRIFDIRMGELTTDNFGSGVHSMAISHDKKSYLASCLDSKVRLVEKKGGEILKEYKGHKASNFSI